MYDAKEPDAKEPGARKSFCNEQFPWKILGEHGAQCRHRLWREARRSVFLPGWRTQNPGIWSTCRRTPACLKLGDQDLAVRDQTPDAPRCDTRGSLSRVNPKIIPDLMRYL